MFTILTVVHIIVGLALILVVLLQTGKGADIGAAFGGGSSQTLFGVRGPQSFLGKLTTVAAVLFMITSLSLAVLSSKQVTSTVIPKDITSETVETKTDSSTEKSSEEIPEKAEKPSNSEKESKSIPETEK